MAQPQNNRANNANGQLLVDSSNPLYIHPSDSPGLVLVPSLFNGVGYRSWRRSVLRALSAKNKVGFINGKCKKPDDDDPLLQHWERCDDMVTSWILNSLAKDIADSVEYANNAEELWKELEDRYDQTNGAKLYQVQKEINDLSRGVLDITGYYTRMKKLWEELNNLSANTICSCQCTCGAKANMHKAEQDRRLIQFLMGLNEVYTTVRGSILMMNPLPSMAQAFSLLIQEEKHREFKPNNLLVAESASLNANFSGSHGFKTDFNSKNHNRNSSRNNRQNNSGGNKYNNNRSYGNAGNTRPRVVCEHCDIPEHTMDSCFKLKPYLKNKNFDNQSYNNSQNRMHNNFDGKGKQPMGSAYAASTDMMHMRENTHGEDQNTSLTKEQYGQIMNLLQHFQMGHAGGSSGSACVGNGLVNFAACWM